MDPATLAAKRGEHRKHREQALAITDLAVAENRQLTKQEAEQVAQHVEQAKAIQGEVEADRLGANQELVKQLERPRQATRHVEPPRPAQLGMKVGPGDTLQVKAAEARHPWALAIEQTSRARGEKAFSAPTGSIPLPALSTVPVSMGMLGAPLVQAIGLRPWPADGGRAVTYLRQTGRVNRAAIWRSGAAPDGSDTPSKPVTDLTTVAVVANAETVAHLASPVKRNDLADFQGMAQWVSNELTYGLTQALEAAILTAAGPEPAMTGLLHLAGTTPVAAAADVAGTIEAAAVALQLLGYGDGLQAAINPADWSGVATAKGADGHYLYPDPANRPGIAQPVRGRHHRPARTCQPALRWSATSASGCHLRARGAAGAVGHDRTMSSAKNLLSARCEGRYALTVPQPAAVAIADLTP